ncbi:farnesyl pyrophosphate synthase-like [Anastrepha ludens]|uniref:farnesyl pyrophosphate synthase-like n=1 Tax=Anastrepha ludens TaxID=28586 RepID=UPI0023AF0691|nr:farnesyl pyrophosphate synthase-like [Anastrepha ludens]XP_053963992.1 farnesyl pyrophosphate synthase-like [Anastrepha ludens]
MKMLSLMRKWSHMPSSIPASVSACCINTTNATYFQRTYSKTSGTVEDGTHNSELSAIHAARRKNFGGSIRALSTLESHHHPSSATCLKMTKDQIREFMAVYPDILRDLTALADKYDSKEAAEWFKKALEYNLSLTNTKNGLITVVTYKSLVKGDELTAEKLKLALILGWCIELLHCALFITDDIVDNSTRRRGQPCWYKLEDVGLNAVNDALIMENGVYELLNKHFRHLDCYVHLMELFHHNTFKCMGGQSLDMLISKQNISTFTMDTYNSIVATKTSCNFLYLPVALGLSLAGVKDQKVYDECKAITFEVGDYSQAQNDYLDSFGNPDFTGKIGTDIQTNKCSWLAVMCMELANPEQKAIMEECYGQNDPKKTARVQQLYEDMDMPRIYAKYEEETYNRIKMRIENTSEEALREVFLEILNFVTLRGIK